MFPTFPFIIAKRDADARQFSNNPFVSGIAKDLLRAIDPLLTDNTSPTSSVTVVKEKKHPYSRQ